MLDALTYVSIFNLSYILFFFFFNDTATTEIYTLSLHDAHPITAQHHRDATDEQRRDQVAETVGVRQRDDAEIQVVCADSHRLANLEGIGQKLFAPETDGARRG